ncbi:MAG: helix-turn-helix domain-containing protein, partial [Pikeienuella sp.]
RLRLERARELLRQTDMRVLDVAAATGFSSGASLARAYRGRFGLCPRADRREPGGTDAMRPRAGPEAENDPGLPLTPPTPSRRRPRSSRSAAGSPRYG